MPQPAAFLGTGISHGGSVIEASPNVKVNGIFVARLGDHVSCSHHGLQTIVSASSNVLANGKNIARLGDLCSCGATLIPPVSPNVLVGG